MKNLKTNNSTDDVAVGTVVRSTAGRDAKRCFVVLARDGEYVHIADGKLRLAETPKRKKLRHVKKIDAEPFDMASEVTNRRLRAFLAPYRAEHETVSLEGE